MTFSDYLIPIDDPGSRLFHWNLLAAAVIIVVWSLFFFGLKDAQKEIRKFIFNSKYWWNRSTRRDYFIFVMNAAFKVFLFVPFLDFTFHVARFVSRGLVQWNGDFLGLSPTMGAIALFTILSFVWDDLLRFTQHVLMHKIPFLWKLHSVHHSAKVLTPVTLYRAHPLESAIATLRNSLSLGVSTGLFVFAFQSQLTVWTIAGVNILGFLFNFLGANLRHSHVPIGFFPWIEKIFISPKQHQIHHSSDIRHRDKNFGVSLSLWDNLLGSWLGSENIRSLKFGLGDRQRRSLMEELSLNLNFEIQYEGVFMQTVLKGSLFLTLVLSSGSALAQNVSAQDQIKSMQGCFEVTFQFVETFLRKEGYPIKSEPYYSKGLEWVEVDYDTPKEIHLQHILITPDGPMKHWRQEWIQNPTTAWSFKGRTNFDDPKSSSRWVKQSIQTTSNIWLQRVTQVDDSPRYECAASWVDNGQNQFWECVTPGPLPRREFSKRSDYDVLVRGNRHELTKDGWIHDEDNKKVQSAGDVLIAEEKGINTYKRVDSKRCQSAKAFWGEQKRVWNFIQSTWRSLYDSSHELKIKTSTQSGPLWGKLFDWADSNKNSDLGPKKQKELTDLINSHLEL